jgi:hypothetical protein
MGQCCTICPFKANISSSSLALQPWVGLGLLKVNIYFHKNNTFQINAILPTTGNYETACFSNVKLSTELII